MRITAKQYATALTASLEGKERKEMKDIIANFCRMLADNNHISLLDRIIEEFSAVFDKEEGIVNVELISGVKADTEIKELAKKYVLAKTSAKTIQLKETIDPEIMGGMILKFGDKIVDDSVRTKLRSLRTEMVK